MNYKKTTKAELIQMYESSLDGIKSLKEEINQRGLKIIKLNDEISELQQKFDEEKEKVGELVSINDSLEHQISILHESNKGYLDRIQGLEDALSESSEEHKKLATAYNKRREELLAAHKALDAEKYDKALIMQNLEEERNFYRTGCMVLGFCVIIAVIFLFV